MEHLNTTNWLLVAILSEMTIMFIIYLAKRL